MTGPVQQAQVVVAVSPQLLSDAVRRTLDLDGIATSDAAAPGRADVAIVTAGREDEVSARVVITLVADAPGTTHDEVHVRDLGQLRAALARLVPRSGD